MSLKKYNVFGDTFQNYAPTLMSLLFFSNLCLHSVSRQISGYEYNGYGKNSRFIRAPE
jgi:Rps23 Pro-64 3,4-dihydroxylase Tpa1-like proline 4-hydroxylase